jgi:hypothetical protein
MQTRRGPIEGKRVGRIRRWDAGGALTVETFGGGCSNSVYRGSNWRGKTFDLVVEASTGAVECQVRSVE